MERKGAVTMKGNPLTLVGSELKVGDKAPDFTVVDQGLKPVKLSDYAGKTVVISVTPSIDTPVCDFQLRKMNADVAGKEGMAVMNISMDLPFAIKKFCAVAEIENALALSDHKDASFGEAYGVLIKELRLLARAIFVVDAGGKISYVEVVPEATDNPDYTKLMSFLG
ncbi:Redoxin domain protein [Denitrovibrio acetiphilus DSM 12809]|uniref:Redoxin domain protein n=1 Tax=Denitrovibrio acetiphilus (strain DSM 12809 / NBRC 114555 / N2460) TaxID=522772 RepID=D4H7C4_DENA2|nr:thiol peroxidase [Denitrovibrio acetiphilus]ADD67923.1 Redoxin domain protein [Denitrovibrio acetiphilus DSM 12809]